MSCRDLVSSNQLEEAAEACRKEFAESGESATGVRMLHALFMLGDDAEVIASYEALTESRHASAVWEIVGRAFYRREDFDRAADAFEKALNLHREAGRDQLIAPCLVFLHDLNWRRSELGDAFRYASSLYELGVQRENAAYEYQGLELLFNASYDIGDLPTAAAAQRLLQPLAEGSGGKNLARHWQREGNLHSAAKRESLARDAYERALDLYRAEEVAREYLRGTLLNLVHMNLQLDEVDRAKRRLDEALEYLPEGKPHLTSTLLYGARVAIAQDRLRQARKDLEVAMRDPATIDDWRWQIDYELGQIAERVGESQGAISAYQSSIEVVERLRASTAVNELKAFALERKRRPFQALAALYVERSEEGRALETIERAKARALLDSLIETSSERDLGEGSGVSFALPATERIASLEAIRRHLSTSPASRFQSVERILEGFGDRYALVYFETEKEILLLVVSNGRVSAVELGMPPEEIRRLVLTFRSDLARDDLARELGRLLLPSSALPNDGSRLHIVTDGFLGQIPFAALFTGGRRLVERFDIAYVPSLSATLPIERETEDRHLAVVLGDPRRDLPDAAIESRAVAETLDVEPALGSAASIEAFRVASRARLLHVASHSGVGSRGPWLRLADGEVSADMIVTERIAPKFVVLATCASAARERPDLWGSLGAAFLAAGSSAVVASLRSIDDEVARRFVEAFYENGGSIDPVAAVARVQRAWIEESQDPIDWAPFVVLGGSIDESSSQKGGES